MAARTDSTLPQFELAPEGRAAPLAGTPPARALPTTKAPPRSRSRAISVRSRTATRCCRCCSGIATTTPRRSPVRSVAGWCWWASTARASVASDVGATPYTDAAPLVYIHANAVNAALQGRFLAQRPAWVLIAVSLIALGARPRPGVSRVLSLGCGRGRGPPSCWSPAPPTYALFVFADIDLPALASAAGAADHGGPRSRTAWGRDDRASRASAPRELDVARSIQEPPAAVGAARRSPRTRRVRPQRPRPRRSAATTTTGSTLEDDALAVVVGDVQRTRDPGRAAHGAHARLVPRGGARPGASSAEMVTRSINSLARAAASRQVRHVLPRA